MQMPQMEMGAASGTDSLPFAAGLNGKMPAERLEMLIFPGITPQVFFGLRRKVLPGCGQLLGGRRKARNSIFVEIIASNVGTNYYIAEA